MRPGALSIGSRTAFRQRGFLMLEVMLALIITALAAVATQRAVIRTNQIDFANIQGDVLDVARRGINFYIFENYIALQNDLPVTKLAVTLANGVAEGQSKRPSIANLRDMGYIPSTFNSTAILNQGVYRFEITKSPAGCVVSACAVDGLVWIDQPILARGSTTEPDGLSVSTIMIRLGGNSAASLLTAPGVLTGAGGSFSLPNPVTGAPAGVVGARVGFNAEVEAAYVRIGDARDPNLAGPLTVAGPTRLNSSLSVNGNVSVTGSITATGTITALGGLQGVGGVGAGSGSCYRSSLESDGRIVARRVNCTAAATIDPNNSLFTMTDAAGTGRIQVDGQNSLISLLSAGGVSQIRISGDGQLQAYDAAGTLVTASLNGTTGRVSAQRTQLTTSATAGASCSAGLEGDIVLDSDTQGGTIVCRGGTWRRSGLAPATDGGACTGNGLGQDTAGTAFICRSNQWSSLNDRIPRSVLIARYLVTDGVSIPHPACPTGAVPAVVMTPVESAVDQTGAPARNRFAAFAVGGVGLWTARIRLYDSTGTGFTTGFDGTSYDLRAIAQTFCDFPT